MSIARLKASHSMLASILIVAASVTACAGHMVKPALSASKPNADALLVLPGFGYSRSGEKSLRALAPAMAGDGIDLYVADFVTRSGLVESRAKLDRFIHENRLERYERLHVFAFIAGAWTFNPLMVRDRLPNLTSVVYDRSPLQERAPGIAADKLRLLAWVKYGSTVFDVATTPYPPLAAPAVHVALMVESRPTAFIRRYEKPARERGPFRFECDAFHQRYDDCLYLPMNHDELYVRFAETWPELRAFIRSGHFTSAADRTPPIGDPFARESSQ